MIKGKKFEISIDRLFKSKEKVDLFFKRAENFLKGANERHIDRDWDLTCFMTEQSAQLFLKAIILEQTSDFPKSHSIQELFGLLYNLTKDDKFKFDRKALIFLESSYFNARYFTFTYEEDDAKEALKIVEEIKKLVGIIRCDEKKK